jgi:hypothetical protein
MRNLVVRLARVLDVPFARISPPSDFGEIEECRCERQFALNKVESFPLDLGFEAECLFERLHVNPRSTAKAALGTVLYL